MYAGTLLLQVVFFHQKVFWGFVLDGFWGHYISMVTHNLYVLPWMMIVSLVVIIYLVYLRMISKKMVIGAAISRRMGKRQCKTLGSSLTGGVQAGLFLILLSMILAVSIGYFGCRRLADEEAEETTEITERIGTDEYEYIALIDTSSVMAGSNQMLHSSGINRKIYESIIQDENVADCRAYIANLSSEVVLSDSDERGTILAGGNVRYQEIEGIPEE